MRQQRDRIVEYEAKLVQTQGKPMLAAVFLLYVLVSVSMMSVIAYWIF